MKITVEDARGLFEAIGQPCGEWNEKKLTARLNSLHEDVEPDSVQLGKAQRATLDRLIAGLKEGKKVTIEVEATVAEPVAKKAPPKKGEKKADKKGKDADKASPKKNGKPKAEKEGGELDAFGSPIGSSNAKVNATLCPDKPKSFGDIMKETGLSRGQIRYAHLQGLEQKGLVSRTKDGWLLKAKGAAKRSK